MTTQKSQKGVAGKDVLAVFAVLLFLFILFSILSPPLHSGHRENARRASCQSNLKQLGLAFIQYEQDSDQQTPPGVNAAGNGWAGQVYPYTKSTGLYRCPDDQHNGSYISYAENRNIVHEKWGKLTAPNATVLLYEAMTADCDPSAPETNSATGLYPPQDSKRHDSEAYSLNFLAADGHAKYLKPGQVSNGPNAFSAKQMPQGAYQDTFAIK